MKKFLKKMLLSDEKTIWPFFSRITEYGRAQVTFFLMLRKVLWQSMCKL